MPSRLPAAGDLELHALHTFLPVPTPAPCYTSLTTEPSENLPCDAL